MPKVQKYEYINQMIHIHKDMMRNVDLYKTVMKFDSRNAAINDIISRYFSAISGQGISPAFQTMLLNAVNFRPNSEGLMELLLSDATDKTVAHTFLEALEETYTEQVSVMRAVLKGAHDTQE